MGRHGIFTLAMAMFLVLGVADTAAAPTGGVTGSYPDEAAAEVTFVEGATSADTSLAGIDTAAPLRYTFQPTPGSIDELFGEVYTVLVEESTDTHTTDAQMKEEAGYAVGGGDIDVPAAPLKTTYDAPAVGASQVVFEPRADLTGDVVGTDATSTQTERDEPTEGPGDIVILPQGTSQHNMQPPDQSTVVTASPGSAESITHLASEDAIVKSTYPTTAPGKELTDVEDSAVREKLTTIPLSSPVDAPTAGQPAQEAAPPGQPNQDGDLNKPGPVPVATARDDQTGSSRSGASNVGLVSGQAASEASKSQAEGARAERQQSEQVSEIARASDGTASDEVPLLSKLARGGVLESPSTGPSEESGREDDVPEPKNGELQRNSNVPTTGGTGNGGQPNTARAVQPSQGQEALGGSPTVQRSQRPIQDQPARGGSSANPRAEHPNLQQGKPTNSDTSSAPRAESEGSPKVPRAEQPSNFQQGQPGSGGSSSFPRAEQPRTEDGRAETGGNSNAPRAEQPNAQQGQPGTGGSSSAPRAEQPNTPKGPPGTPGSSAVPRAEQPKAQQGQPGPGGSASVPRAEQPNAQQGPPGTGGSSNVPRAEQPNAQQGKPGTGGSSTVPREGQPTAQQGQPGTGGSSSVPRAEHQETPVSDGSANRPRAEQSNPQQGKPGSSSDAPRAEQSIPQQGQPNTGGGSNVPRAAEPSPQQKQQGSGTNPNIPRAEQAVPQQGPQGAGATSNVPRAEQQNPTGKPNPVNGQSKPEGPRTEVPKGPPPPSTGNNARGDVPAAKGGEAGRTGDGKGKTTVDVKTSDPVVVVAPKDPTTKVTVEDKTPVAEDNKNPPTKKHETVESETHVAVDEAEPEEHTKHVVHLEKQPEHKETAEPEPELEIRNVTVEVEPEQPDKKPKAKPKIAPPVLYPVQPVVYPPVYPPPLVVNQPYPQQPVIYQPYQPPQPTVYQPGSSVAYPQVYQPAYPPVHHMAYGAPMPYHPGYHAHPVGNHHGSYGSYQPQPQYTPAYSPYGQPHYQPAYRGQYNPPMSHDYTVVHQPAYIQPQPVYGSGHQTGPSHVYAPGPYTVQPLAYHVAQPPMYGPQYQPGQKLSYHRTYRRAPRYGGPSRQNYHPVAGNPAVRTNHIAGPGNKRPVMRPVQPSAPHPGYKRDMSYGYAPSSQHFAPVVTLPDYNGVSMKETAMTKDDLDIYSHVPEASERMDTNYYTPLVVDDQH